MFERKKYKKIIKFLHIKKPLVIFSLETTGPSISADKIMEIAFIKIIPNGRVMKGNYIINPEIEISKESMAIHNIKKADLKDKPTFKKMSREIWDIFNNCYYSGFNIMNFYLPILRREFIRVGLNFEYTNKNIIDSKIIFNYMEPRTLSGTYRYYCAKEHLNIYNAEADTEVATQILFNQLEKYKEIRSWRFIKEINKPSKEKFIDHKRKFYWRKGEAYFTFSKYKDTPLSEVVKTNPAFLKWILKANFSDEAKSIVKKALESNKKNKKIPKKTF